MKHVRNILAVSAYLALAACGADKGGPVPPAAVAPAPVQQAAAAYADTVLVGDTIVAQWPVAMLPAGGVVAPSLTAGLALHPRVTVIQGGTVAQLPASIQQAQAAGSCVVVVSVIPSNSPEDLAAQDRARRQAAWSYGASYADAYSGLVVPPVDVATRRLHPELPPDGHTLRAGMDAGDGVHLTAAGYYVLGTAVSEAMGACL